jgi:hypothetical protein
MRQGLCVRFALPEGEFCSWLYERSALPSTPGTSTLKNMHLDFNGSTATEGFAQMVALGFRT